MHHTLLIECRTPGVVHINGFFCGPLEGDAQAFPVGRNAQIYIQFFPYGRDKLPLTVAMRIEDGRIVRLDPQDAAYALVWPDGVIQLELAAGEAQEPAQQSTEGASSATLLRYLTAKLAGDMQADSLLLRAQDGVDLLGYEAAVPLRYPPSHTPERYDERAGLLRRAAPNVAYVDAALAATVPAGQGKRMIERVEIVRT
ncbi:MAG: hypothetical protein IKB82_04905 [Clostridia bacterium]|nr:hypothetical protein [Clostridia bacterium]